MFPILVWVYIRLARREEAMALAEFGDEYRAYQDRTPAWIPAWNVAKEPTHSH
jgi:protein-S-isoprenylcysteine O-methyltransferase Ste14